ncbi:hypothetical protein M419DRAFT_85523 [Trichoderma reesei RUT C-30]|uniref:Rhodopsin domain-containing protein n=1 Tax=Hypocrea jecorina (strain ATCC 56765 / BCRC 32924 / NRRL 11460 / Rut C-30) TaxID=1344414 RepID=A0A024S342_HYPJR|nr:hypothetical protein M419DRAFT_85523 [Trichoderma reesei RUT C-30]
MINLGIDGPLLSRRDAIDDGDPNPRGESLARLSIIFVCLAGFFVVLRLLTRHFHTKAFGADDALIVVALALSVCMTVAYNGEAGNGFGLHSDQINQEHKILAFKYFFAAQILYKVATCLTKSSLGMLYLRIFPGHKFRIAVITVVGVTVAYTFAAVLMTVFACKPIEKAWRKTLPGVCVNSISIWYSTSVLNIVTDILIIGLPVNEIRRLQLPLARKLLLCALFSLGVFVIACTVIRMITVSPQTTASDQTYYQAVSNSWTFVETNVGIMCACLPIVWVPITRQILRLFGLGREETAATSKSGQTYSLGSHGLVSSARGRTSPRDAEGDSVEELMFHGIKMTRRFSAHVVREDQGQNEAPVSDRPWEHVPQPAPP